MKQYGYEDKLANYILLRGFNKPSVKKLLGLHQELIKYFTHEQIIKIVSQRGGFKNLELIISAYETFMEIGLSKDQIVYMASHHDGFKNLKALENNADTLKKQGAQYIEKLCFRTPLEREKFLEGAKLSHCL